MFSSSKHRLLAATLTPLILCGVAFYLVQNNNGLPGGEVALSKIFWLGLVIFYWYVAPALLLFSGIKCAHESVIIKVHLINVWLRAIIELYMMYGSQNWSPYYGITHDLLSLCLLLGILYLYRQELCKTTARLFIVLSAIFAVETCFAYYMVSSVPADAGPIYFVPQSPEYSQVLMITWVVVISLLLYMFSFVKSWLNYDA